jgi:hypothetical protein
MLKIIYRDFLQYCMAYSLNSDGEVDADYATGKDAGGGGGVKNKGDGGKMYVKRSGQRLTNFSEKRVKEYFNLFLEANLFKTVPPAKFDIIAAQKK